VVMAYASTRTEGLAVYGMNDDGGYTVRV
jgi:hypothetical protein